ncbi:MAG: DUF4397 domain-containing protein [Gemmatimonadota bacterium]|nr:DUF4397 domain-containing protein [Gemmatimonadota bacterium]
MLAIARWTLGAVLIGGVACSPRPKDQGVKTSSDWGTSASPSSEAAARRDHSMIRVVNTVAGRTKVTLLADNQPLFDNVASSEVTPYKEVHDNAVKFSVRRSDQATASGEEVNREVMADGERYTAVVLSDSAGQTSGLRMLRDELVPDSGKARIRVIHAAPGTGEVDVILAGQSDDLFSGINFGNEAGFKDVTPASGTLEIRRKNEQLLLTSVKMPKLLPGVAYTVVLVGGPKTKLTTITFEDRARPVDVSLNP